MARDYKPEPHTVCVECRQPIGNEEYLWTKSRGYPPTFIHMRCYEKLLPKKTSYKKSSTFLEKIKKIF